MKMKKFLLPAMLSLLLSPMVSAGELSGDELGTGTPSGLSATTSAAPTATTSASDELGTGSSVASATTWWEQFLKLFR